MSDEVMDDKVEMQGKWDFVQLESISLFLEESALLKGPSLSDLLSHANDRGAYEAYSASRDEDLLLSPRLWNLPEIFRKKPQIYTQNANHELNRQLRIVDIVCYNFSNGWQISAAEILRHPLHRKVPLSLLPDGKIPASPFGKWPILQQTDKSYTTMALLELETIVQNLLDQVAQNIEKNKVPVFIQARNQPQKAIRVNAIEFEASREVSWRADFHERSELEAQIKLITKRNKQLHFYESFALNIEDGIVVVHPWLTELSLFQESLSHHSSSLILKGPEVQVDLVGELEVKSALRYLRSRSLPVQIEGISQTYKPQQSRLQIHMDKKGLFYPVVEVSGWSRKGWSSKSALFLQTLSKGLPFMLGVEPKEMASRAGARREWDLKLLKNLGILQYVFFETLHYHFEGSLSDGSKVTQDQIFGAIHVNVRNLLISGAGSTFVQDVPLVELCSKSTLTGFESFISLILKAIEASESYYSEKGEIILEGIVEKELRLVFELIRSWAGHSGGEIFKRSRTSILSRIAEGDWEKDVELKNVQFKFPTSESSTHGLEYMQGLVIHGFKLYYNGAALQELEEDEFHVDFVLETDGDSRMFNWFELNPKFFLRGEQVDPDHFLSLGSGGVIEYKGHLYLVPQKQLPSLKRLERFWEKLQKGKLDTGRRQNGDKIYQLPRHQTLELLALRASGIGIRGDEEWKKLCRFYDGLGKSDRNFVKPESTQADLKPYQSSGVQWLQDLYNLRLGALLADDMGLGKTLQTLTFLDGLRAKNEMGQVLIVVPSSLIYNWISEAQKFTPQLRINVFSSKDHDTLGRKLMLKEDTVVMATYGLLMEHEAFFNQYKWKVIVFDEAQNLKNITTKRTSVARSLTAQFKICLTGTPMENHYGEFYSIVDLLVPGSLGKIDDFRRQFVNTDLITREEMEDLKLKIRPLLLRRTKKEILDQLPEKSETKISIAFEEKQKEIYRDIALSYNQRVQEALAVKGEASVQLQMLTALLRLRQACSDPSALPNVKYEKVPPKLETLLDSIKEIVESGESALVFTQFLQTLEHTCEIMKAAGIVVFALHGGIPTKQRQKILADFQNTPSGAVLVMTLKTGGVGLNLTKASYVFHLEPWWNPSVENQATDRAHRLGQNRAVQVFRYIMHESLEEKIEILKERKDKKFQSLFVTTEKVTDLEKGTAALSKQDFDYLLGLK